MVPNRAWIIFTGRDTSRTRENLSREAPTSNVYPAVRIYLSQHFLEKQLQNRYYPSPPPAADVEAIRNFLGMKESAAWFLESCSSRGWFKTANFHLNTDIWQWTKSISKSFLERNGCGLTVLQTVHPPKSHIPNLGHHLSFTRCQWMELLASGTVWDRNAPAMSLLQIVQEVIEDIYADS